MTTDVRKKRGAYLGPNNERRITVSGNPSEIRKEIDVYAQAGLEYYCASINHSVAAEIIVDLKKFLSEVKRSFG